MHVSESAMCSIGFLGVFKKLACGLCVGASAFAGVARAQSADAVIGPSYAQSREAPRPALKIAKGAPNIIWIMLDDTGFGASSSFGGLVQTPTFDKLANNGLRYTNFHTTGVCSPTRAALMTGRNHHKVGMGLFPSIFLSAEFPGYTGRLQSKDGTIAEYLRDAGYSTYQLGKWHLTPDVESTGLGPFDRWPSGKGFEHNFGFLGGATDQYKPDLVEDNMHVKPDGRHLNAQLVDKAISYVDRQKKLSAEKPFFMYLAPGATHSPHQVDQVWIDKYKGKFDAGWDAFREQILEKQKKLGIVAADAQLPTRDPRVPAWNKLTPEEKKINARFMESYAGFLEYTDSEIGRLVDHLQQIGLAENTAIFVIIGDNGGSKEGGMNGNIGVEFQKMKVDAQAQIKDLSAKIDKIGTREVYSNYPIGWAQTANTPFRQWKADANAEGATRNPLIVYWPGHVEKGIRTQYSHVIDLLPTTLEMAGLATPKSVRSISQEPIQGVSLAYSFSNVSAPTRHTQQYFFLFGSGAIVKDGWKASFNYHPDYFDIYETFPPQANPPNNAGKEVWELYNLNADFNERHDLASRDSKKLQELQAAFKKEIEDNHGYPLINWTDIDVKHTEFMKNAQPRASAPGND